MSGDWWLVRVVQDWAFLCNGSRAGDI